MELWGVLALVLAVVLGFVFWLTHPTKTDAGPPGVLPNGGDESATSKSARNESALQQRSTRSHSAVIVRASLIDELAAEWETTTIHSKVAGVTYRNDDHTSRQSNIKHLSSFEELWLIPEPENEFHDKAIRVETYVGNQIGYLQRRLAEEVFNAFAVGDDWRCFVSEVTGWDHPVRGVNIVLLRKDVTNLARPKEDREFEAWATLLGRECGHGWRYARLTGLHQRNEDGSDRREILLALPHRHRFRITIEGDHPEKAQRVHLLDPDGRIAAVVAKDQGRMILDAVSGGYKWSAVLRNCTQVAGKFEAHVALFKVKQD